MTKGDILFEIVTKEQLLNWLEHYWNQADELAVEVSVLKGLNDNLTKEIEILSDKVAGQSVSEALKERTILASEGIPEGTGEEVVA